MKEEFVPDEREQNEIVELTTEELDVVSGGCGAKCCQYQVCGCGGD